jgi:hypothetical protein
VAIHLRWANGSISGLDKVQVGGQNIGPGLRYVMVFPRGLGQTEIGLWAVFHLRIFLRFLFCRNSNEITHLS